MPNALIVTPEGDPVADWTVDPFRTFRVPLRARLGLSLRFAKIEGLADLRATLESSRCDVAFVGTPFRAPAEDTVELFASLSSSSRRPKIVYLDTFDQVTSPFFGVLPHVDLYLKKQLLRDVSAYGRSGPGEDPVSDWMVETLGVDLEGWSFRSPVDEAYEDRLWLGWNLGSVRFLINGMLRTTVRRPVPWSKRKLDVHYRVSYLPPEDPPHWYTAHRRSVLEALQPIAGEPRVVAAAGKEARVPMDVFAEELRQARIGVSPFGWGEVTDRDFRVVTNRSLLLKPDMSHLRTEPDIFLPGVTYVPFRWDATDLVEKIHYYLDHPHAADRIARTARKAYQDWFLTGRFVGRIQEVLEHLHVG
ncbi:MAG: glycosyltransferase [Sandaracinaceae bacterium]